MQFKPFLVAIIILSLVVKLSVMGFNSFCKSEISFGRVLEIILVDLPTLFFLFSI